jgi:hypothetical protein
VNITVPKTFSPPSRSSPPVRARTWLTTASGTNRAKTSRVKARSNASRMYQMMSAPKAESTSAISG